jgi:hypothetical protein
MPNDKLVCPRCGRDLTGCAKVLGCSSADVLAMHVRSHEREDLDSLMADAKRILQAWSCTGMIESEDIDVSELLKDTKLLLDRMG